jgi:flagellar biosynthetic protein FliR
MIGVDELVGRALYGTLAFCRFAGFLAASPFPTQDAPRRVRASVAIAFALLAASLAPPEAAPALRLGIAATAAAEIALGAAMGVVFRVLLSAAEAAGGLVSTATGLNAQSMFLPSADSPDETVIGKVIMLGALSLVVASGAHRVVIAYVFESLRLLPIGAPLRHDAIVPLVAELAGHALSSGVRLAMPVAAVSLIVHVVLALVARAAPSLQIFSLGFGVLIAAGLLTLVASLPAIGAGLLQHVEPVGALVLRTLEALDGRPR